MAMTRRWLSPGEWYRIQDRSYQLPLLPLKGKALMQTETLQVAMRDLMSRSSRCLSTARIPSWLSGGTLVGFVRHGTFLPWDDNINLHAPWKFRDYLFSSAFAVLAARSGLEVLFLPNASLDFADREGAAVRLRRVGTQMPVCEIFLVEQQSDGSWAKIDSWCKTEQTSSARERWTSNQLFPVQPTHIDGLTLELPCRPVEVLQQQYGHTVMSEMHVDENLSRTAMLQERPWVVRGTHIARL